MYVLTNTRMRIKVYNSLKRLILGFSTFLWMNVLLPIHTNVAEKTADIWRRYHWFRRKWCLRNERRNSILMTRYHPDLGSASDWSCRVGNWLQPIRGTIQICLVTRHQYGTEFLHSFRFSDVISQGNHWWRLEMSAVFSTSFPGFSPTRPTERERERPWTSVFQGLSLSSSVWRVGENPGNEVAVFSG